MKPLKSKIEVYEIGEEDRVYEAVTSDGYGNWGREATQISGPELPVFVSESRTKFWGGGNPPPTSWTRKHNVYHQPEGEKYPIPMDEVRTPAEVQIFKKHGKHGERTCFVPATGID